MKKNLTTGLLMSVFLISNGLCAAAVQQSVASGSWEYDGVQISVPGNAAAITENGVSYCAADSNFQKYGALLARQLIKERHADRLAKIMEKNQCLNSSIAFNFSPYAQSFVNYFQALLTAIGSTLAAAKAAKWTQLPLNVKDAAAKIPGVTPIAYVPTFNLLAFEDMPAKGKTPATASPFKAALNTIASTVPFDVDWLSLFTAYNNLVHKECAPAVVTK